ncbi:MAG: VOC family protein [Candidatus Aenigmarchaeota archaeon]|nr:VOC family protein [Candidatus Aenigmarchaeota archaeon]
MDKVVHFEIPVDDIKRAEKFYNSTFGRGTNSVPGMGYTLVTTVETDEKMMPKEPGAINGGMMKRTDKIKSPVVTIGVSDVDEALENVKNNGGSILMEKTKIGDMGYSAYFKDTEGNIVGLWQNLKEE